MRRIHHVQSEPHISSFFFFFFVALFSHPFREETKGALHVLLHLALWRLTARSASR